MGKTSKWLRNFLTGKKDKEKEKSPSNQIFSTSSEYPATPISIRHNPKEKNDGVFEDHRQQQLCQFRRATRSHFLLRWSAQ